MSQLSRETFCDAYKNVQKWWRCLDEAIFELIRRYPEHRNVEEVFGKVAIVNRAYNTNLLMRGGMAEWNLAEAMVKENFDEILRADSADLTFCRDALPIVLAVHWKLVELSHKANGRREVSFAAKYLSFHFPQLFPIFDSKSYRNSWKLVGAALPKGLHRDGVSVDYGYHCESVLSLVEQLRAGGESRPDLKTIDYVLYSA